MVPSLVANIINVQKVVTLRDFALSYTEENGKDGSGGGHIEELDKIWKNDTDTKGERVQRGRLLTAWKAAFQSIERLDAAPTANQS